jgi:Mg2+-importing ATPase
VRYEVGSPGSQLRELLGLGTRSRLGPAAAAAPNQYWAEPLQSLLGALRSSEAGLAAAAAAERLRGAGRNTIGATERTSALRIWARQFASPLMVILIFAASVSAFVGDWPDAGIVLAIVLGSGALGGAQEQRASSAVERLRNRVRVTATVLRDGKATPEPREEIVPGDVVLLAAGSLVPGDGVVLESRDFFVNEAVLTGEPVPVEKLPGRSAPESPLAGRRNCVFLGTSVRSGTARVLIVATGAATEFGAIAGRLALTSPETDFERGLRNYGYLLYEIMLVLVLIVFAANVFLARPPIEALLFAMALAVGISPELLPAIISVTLSAGAREMASRGVIVRRLHAIENLGSMTVLCSDKTGTLTRGVLELEDSVDADGRASSAVLRAAALNARLQTGLPNPLDEAIDASATRERIDLAACRKVDEVPYDFLRKRLSVVVEEAGSIRLVTKGAVPGVLDCCSEVERGDAAVPLDAGERRRLDGMFDAWSAAGKRVLAVATKTVARRERYGRDEEHSLAFAGFLVFSDLPKPGVDATIRALAQRGIKLKIVTGDVKLVAEHVAAAVGIPAPRSLAGEGIAALTDRQLAAVARQTDVFAEVDPGQKERIVAALRRRGEVVGYLGDGINDAPALHAADVGISVDTAVDVAREAADFVLLEQDLDVLCRGVEQGRKTFANTLKYLSITTSANFGNMLSMAAASLFMPFLPLLAKQILLNNFLSDIPSMTIATDNVDSELVAGPRRWDIATVRRFMLGFGSISSAFDFLTFAVLLLGFHAGAELFRTGWFLESLLTELAILLVLRTRRAAFRSRPGRWLAISTALTAVVALAVPYLPFAGLLGFVPLPAHVLGALLAVTAAYVTVSELAKGALLPRVAHDAPPGAFGNY